MSIDASLLREIIMDHYEYPRNKSLTDQSGYASEIGRASCRERV